MLVSVFDLLGPSGAIWGRVRRGWSGHGDRKEPGVRQEWEPEDAGEIPVPTVSYVAQQVRVAEEEWAAYDWSGRATKRHRMEIRGAFGLRECTEEDQGRLAEWPAVELCGVELNRDRLAEAVVARCREDRMEPPAPGQIVRMVGKAVSTFEERRPSSPPASRPSSPRSPPGRRSRRRCCGAGCCWCCSRWGRTWASSGSRSPASTARARPSCAVSGTCSSTGPTVRGAGAAGQRHLRRP